MKFKILILLVLPTFLFSYNYSYYDYLREENILKAKEILLEHERELQKVEEEKERRRKAKVEEKTRESKMRNEEYYRSLRYDSSYNNRYTGTSSNVKKTYSPKDFKNKPQLKIGELHILGISSIKPFKNNKYIIKAANGTFALPKEKFKEAKKINFNARLLKDIE